MEDALLHKMIGHLKQELREIQFATHALESLAAGKPRRGRPPKIVAEFSQIMRAAGKRPRSKPGASQD